MINQSAIRGLKCSLLVGLDGRVAYKRLDLHDGGNLQLAQIVYPFALLSNQLQSAWIVCQWMSTVVSKVGSTVSSTVGSTASLTVGSTVGLTWLC